MTSLSWFLRTGKVDAHWLVRRVAAGWVCGQEGGRWPGVWAGGWPPAGCVGRRVAAGRVWGGHEKYVAGWMNRCPWPAEP